jgi:hypothetical protein
MRPLIIFVFLATLFFQCKTQKIPATDNANHPARFIPDEQIGFNDALVLGHIIYKNNEYYFQIEKILKRGRSLPVISNEESVLLKEIESNKIKTNETVKGILRCINKPGSEKDTWIFIPE